MVEKSKQANKQTAETTLLEGNSHLKKLIRNTILLNKKLYFQEFDDSEAVVSNFFFFQLFLFSPDFFDEVPLNSPKPF